MVKKLKDVNKDGKINFKDTWLGERLTTKGKLKGPNLAESLKGARRESSETTSTKSTTTPKAKPPVKVETTPTSSPRPKSKPASMDAGSRVGAQSRPVKSTAELRASMEKKKPVAKESTGGPARMPVPKGTTYEDWKKMGRGERQRLGLPVSDIGGEIGFKRFLTGITGKEYKMNEPNRPEAPKKPISQMVKRKGYGSQTYSTKGKN